MIDMQRLARVGGGGDTWTPWSWPRAGAWLCGVTVYRVNCEQAFSSYRVTWVGVEPSEHGVRCGGHVTFLWEPASLQSGLEPCLVALGMEAAVLVSSGR